MHGILAISLVQKKSMELLQNVSESNYFCYVLNPYDLDGSEEK